MTSTEFSNGFAMWGLNGALPKRSAPYFNGSYVKALQTVFPKLGLDPLAFELDYRTRDRGIESVRFVLTREVPDIMERYRKISESDEEGVRALARDVGMIKGVYLTGWGLAVRVLWVP